VDNERISSLRNAAIRFARLKNGARWVTATIDGQTRAVAGELLGKQRVKAPTGWNRSWNPGSSAGKNSLRCDKSAKR
jgi:hypothetical protein